VPIYELDGKRPSISSEAFIHPESVIIGDVTIGPHCFIGPGAVIRADFGCVRIDEGSSIQDNVVIHVNGKSPGVVIEHDVIVGHGAILHDAHVGPWCVVGMGAILLYDVYCEERSIVAAGSVLRRGMQVPRGKLAAGNPARIIKDVSPEFMDYVKDGVAIYRRLSQQYPASMKRVDQSSK